MEFGLWTLESDDGKGRQAMRVDIFDGLCRLSFHMSMTQCY